MSKKKNPTATQASLFDMSINDETLKDAIFLKMPNALEFDALTSSLYIDLDSERLKQIAAAMKQPLQGHTILTSDANGKPRPCQEIIPILSCQQSTIRPLAAAIAFMLCEPDNLRVYTDSLSEEMRELWRQALIRIYVSEEEAMSILKTSKPILTQKDTWYFSGLKFTQPGFEMFEYVKSYAASTGNDYYRRDINFIRPVKPFYKHLLHLLFPEMFDTERSLATLPAIDFRVLDMEQESVNHYPLLASMLISGKLTMTAKGVSLADIKRVAKQMGLTEFYQPSAHPMRHHIRSRFYLTTMGLCHHLRPSKGKKKASPAPETYHEQLRWLFTNADKLAPYLVAMLLPHIKGLRKAMTDDNKVPDLFHHFCQWMHEESERWVSIHDIFLKVYYLEEDQTPAYIDTLGFWPFDQKAEVEIVNEFSNKKIAADSFASEFGYTSLQAIAFMLASLGMAELALSPLHRNDSPFAQACYVRLTPLGRYALGETDEYEPPEEDHVAYFELDPDRLIIRSLVEPNPYAQLLLDTSTAISRNRFETSAQSFLAHCANRSDVEEKIGIFQQFISSELPPLWKRFFDSLLQHCNPLIKEKSDYLFYRLSPDNADLIRLLASDPVLRSLFVRAEGHLILVRKNDHKKFIDELKKHGYLL